MKPFALSVNTLIGVALMASGLPAQATGSSTQPPVNQPAENEAVLTPEIRHEDFASDVRPQDDFYQYVNGGWMARTEIPDGKQTVGVFDAIGSLHDRQVRDLLEELAVRSDLRAGTSQRLVAEHFRSYMNSDKVNDLGLEPIRDLLDSVKSINTVEQAFVFGARLDREGIRGPLYVFVHADLKDSTRNTAYLVPSGLTLRGSAEYLGLSGDVAQRRENLLRYIEALFDLARLSDVSKKAQSVLTLETELARLHRPTEKLRDITGYHPYLLADLDQVSTLIPWDSYLAAAGLDKQSQIVVRSPEYVLQLGTLLKEHPLQSWKDYWTFRVLDGYAELLDGRFVNARAGFLTRSSTTEPRLPPRSERAVKRVTEDLKWPLAEVYAEKHFGKEVSKYMDQMIDNLIEAFEAAIANATWLGDVTKARAQLKLSKVGRRIGRPDAWPDYSKLRLNPDDLVGNVRRARAFFYDLGLAKLSKPFDPEQAFIAPLGVFASYDIAANTIEFASGILQPPLVVMGAEDAYNYAVVGQIIGHELGHGFDDEGRKLNGAGNLVDWWTKEDSDRYQALADRLAQHFSQFEPLEGFNVDGQRTIGEIISDLTGLVLGYNAYLATLGGGEAPVINGFTGQQRFLINFARAWRNKYTEERLRQRIQFSHAPPPSVRANGPLMHFTPFYDAFDVKGGDGMWLPPEKRVKIW